MKIALAQMKMERGLEANFLKSVRLIKDAAAQGAELVCFPELQLSPFFPQYPDQDSQHRFDVPCLLCGTRTGKTVVRADGK